MTLGNSPKQNTVIRCEQRKSFALGFHFKMADDSAMDLTGCELNLTVKDKPRFGDISIIGQTIEVVESLTGYALLTLQAAQLNQDPREYDFAITMVTAGGYVVPVLKGVFEVVYNPDPVFVDEEYFPLTPPEALSVKIMNNNVVNVKHLALPLPTFEVVSETLATGEDATATITGYYPNQILTLGLPRGPQGIEGDVGPEGPAGPEGPRGFTGPASSTPGPQGAMGPQGPAGVDGADGADGADGSNGSPGAQGTPGATGATGATGPTGAAGATGATGAAGADGDDGDPGHAPGIPWRYDSNSDANSNPGTGDLRISGGGDQIAISHTDHDGNGQSAWIATLDNHVLNLQDNLGNSLAYLVTNIVDSGSGWSRLDGETLISNGGWVNNVELRVLGTAPGVTGPEGPEGPAGEVGTATTPEIIGTPTSAYSGSTSSLDIVLPSDIEEGDLICIFAGGGYPVVSAPSEYRTFLYDNDWVSVWLGIKEADGTEGGDTVGIGVTSGGAPLVIYAMVVRGVGFIPGYSQTDKSGTTSDTIIFSGSAQKDALVVGLPIFRTGVASMTVDFGDEVVHRYDGSLTSAIYAGTSDSALPLITAVCSSGAGQVGAMFVCFSGGNGPSGPPGEGGGVEIDDLNGGDSTTTTYSASRIMDIAGATADGYATAHIVEDYIQAVVEMRYGWNDSETTDDPGSGMISFDPGEVAFCISAIDSNGVDRTAFFVAVIGRYNAGKYGVVKIDQPATELLFRTTGGGGTAQSGWFQINVNDTPGVDFSAGPDAYVTLSS